ncbi:Crp/Fnr family transcriptional regulator [Sinorhizobium meliloti]|nr:MULTISPECIES: Crp/Fnr family transcriptional regulator [Sinorhizobium]MBO1944178.1 Crp/Fnr family transcriptional regulator [Sinorhizobium medicae]MDE3775601.1 Crp/Fnr family transcriptional regulator [Sinorhizobium meliloti]RVI51734.1 Crp/Fnr family transcriptional regulator [Sinorhizobium meliloti]RVK73004.1 Crp/Fnr family transcriptional regulator [Sinorhizobium meliloti]RVO35404.1 Crp/Fnr family transcriptional regulator [Sinorhizobium meliloti]
MNAQVVSMQDARTRATCSQAFPVADLSSLFARQPVERFAPAQAVFWEGDEATHIFEVTVGMLRALRLLGDGRRIIVGFLRPGDLLGVSLKERYLYTVEAVSSVELRRFPRRRFEDEVARHSNLQQQLFSRLRDEMTAAQDQAVLLSRRSAEEKLANFFLLMGRNQNCKQTSIVDLPMTRLDIADYLGMTIETVSRTITKLANSGVIATPERRSVTVLKMETLRSLADGDESDYWTPSPYRVRSMHPPVREGGGA